jgi:hypothetical protein
MKPRHSSITLALGLLVPLAALASPADPCLVGHWQPEGNGAAEWVQRQAPGMRMGIQQQVADMWLRADGSYSVQAQLRTRADGADLQGRSQASFAGQGRWSAHGNQLTLTPVSGQSDGDLEVGNARGASHRFRLPAFKPQPTVQHYSCTASTLETRMQVRGVADPIVQRYRRK